MMSLSSRYGLIFKLLFAIKIGRNKPTWIMNEIKTPRKVTSELLSGMMGSGFIECSEKKNERVLRKQYHITTKGNQLYESLMLSQGVVEYNQ
jgi:predicted transcriptional regulator